MFQEKDGSSSERGYGGMAQLLVFTALGLSAYYSGSFSSLLGAILYGIFATHGALLLMCYATGLLYFVYGSWVSRQPVIEEGKDAAKWRELNARLQSLWAKHGARSAVQIVYLIVVFAVVSVNYWR